MRDDEIMDIHPSSRTNQDVTDTVKIQVGKNTSDIEHIKTKLNSFDEVKYGLSTVKQELVTMKRGFDAEQASFKSYVNTKMTELKSDIKWIRGVMIAILFCIIGVIPTMIVGTMSYGLDEQGKFEKTLEDKVDKVSHVNDSLRKNDLKVYNKRIDKLDNKIDKVIDLLIQKK